ncbi:MAG: DegT/DnrJ/EryC1/StrS family aminotransferase [Myxococcales bacterium]|nr:DegT/DnrJ/EryC1/StrS family aminotransferase [Myxococcales bacterium]
MSTDSAIPMVDLTAQHAPLMAELREAIERVVASGHFILGEEVERFESEIASELGVAHALGVSSGTDALLLSLMALDLAPGDEVITTPFSFFATTACIQRLGLRPVFVDIEEHSFNLDLSRVEAAITERTRALLPVHLYGQLLEPQALRALCERHGLRLVEDAAQAIGVSRDGFAAGSVGDYGCFSFFPTKNLGCFGDGGLVTSREGGLADRARLLRGHGARPKYHHLEVGGNFRLDAIQAAVLRVKLPHVRAWNAARRRNADRYDTLLAAAGLPESRLRTPGRVHPEHNFHQYVIRSDRRDALRNHLREKGIASEVYYPLPLHLQPCFRDLGYAPGDMPRAERAAEEALALPVFPELGEERLRHVATTVIEFLGAGG